VRMEFRGRLRGQAGRLLDPAPSPATTSARAFSGRPGRSARLTPPPFAPAARTAAGQRSRPLRPQLLRRFVLTPAAAASRSSASRPRSSAGLAGAVRRGASGAAPRTAGP
jgi:hypothetical protein